MGSVACYLVKNLPLLYQSIGVIDYINSSFGYIAVISPNSVLKNIITSYYMLGGYI